MLRSRFVVATWFLFTLCLTACATTGRPVTLPHASQLRTNQIGFHPDQLKEVMLADGVSQRTRNGSRRFYVVPAGRPTEHLYAGTLTDYGFDKDSGERVRRGDFTSFRTPGRYQILVPKDGLSVPFQIGQESNHQVLQLASRWFYLQRSGAPKDDTVSGLRHQTDYTAPSPLRSGMSTDGRIAAATPVVDVSGGWWDAGDFGRYVPSAATTIMSLLYAYRFNPGAFADGSLTIPESGNGIPDLLDELRWELNWLLKMQRKDGAVYHKAATREYADGMADQDSHPALLYEISTQATAQFAGALAEASIVYRALDPAFATRLLQAAVQAWTFLGRHPEKLPAGGFRNPDDPNGGDYSVKEASEDEQRLWAAAALFHATAERAYSESFQLLWSRRAALPVYGLEWSGGYAFGMFAYLDSPTGTPELKAQLRAVVAEQSKNLLSVIHSNAYHVALSGQTGLFGYSWGSVGRLLNYATYLLLANRLQPDAALVAGAAAQLNWVLGANPLGKVFFTGAGTNPVRYPHHRPSFQLGRAVPGAVGEGPNAMNVGGDPVLQRLFDAGVPAAKRYADDPGSWATNEPTIYYNAAFVAVVAWFAQASSAPVP